MYDAFILTPLVFQGTDLFRDKTSDLRNQKLNIITFEHVPSTKKIPFPEYKTSRSIMGHGEIGFSGLEIEVKIKFIYPLHKWRFEYYA